MESLKLQKPLEVKRAVNCLWASLALGLIRPFLDFHYMQQISAQTSVIFILFIAITCVVILAWLIYKISQGRNWARIIYLASTLIGLLPYLPTLIIEFNRSPLIAAISVLQFGLQIFALWLVFTKPGSAWFKLAKVAA